MKIIQNKGLLKNIRLGVFTTVFILTSFFYPASNVNAVVIKSTDKLNNNYELHHKIINYNNLSSYQNNNKQNLISLQNISDLLIDDQGKRSNSPTENNEIKLTQFPIDTSDMETIFSLNITSKDQTDLLPENERGDNYQEKVISSFLDSFDNGKDNNDENILVGSFLDSFKDDPLLKSIFFTSKDLVFSYKRKIANVLQLGFESEESDYKKYVDTRNISPEEADRPLTAEERKNLKREAELLSGYISDSYLTIIYIFAAMFAAIYLSFRYILNKYI